MVDKNESSKSAYIPPWKRQPNITNTQPRANFFGSGRSFERRDRFQSDSFTNNNELMRLKNENAEHVLMTFVSEERLQNIFYAEIEHSTLIILVNLISKMCVTDYIELRKLMLCDVMKGTFIQCLNTFLSNLPQNIRVIGDVKDFLRKLYKIYASILNTFPENQCENVFRLVKVTLDSLSHLTHDCDFQTQARKNFNSLDEPIVQSDTDNQMICFRKISPYPLSSELLSKVPFEKGTKIENYTCLEQFLDVQFRILRTSFIEPIRKSIAFCTTIPDEKLTNAELVGELLIYNRIIFLDKNNRVGGIRGTMVQFEFENIGAVNYTKAHHLRGESMVLFTNDKFNSVIVGIVLHDNNMLRETKGCFYVHLVHNDKVIYNTDYMMVECLSYFVAYNKPLHALQNMSCENHILSKYITTDQKHTANAPKYLHANSVFNVDGIKFAPLQKENWPEPESLGLDRYQHDAFMNALSREYAIIQGNHGTGKKYLLLKIIKTLLTNAPDKQILLIAGTNNVLDEMLEKSLQFTNDITRLGRQSKNNKIDKYNMHVQFKPKYQLGHDASNRIYKKINDKERTIECLNEELRFLKWSSTFGIVWHKSFRVLNGATKSDVLKAAVEWLSFCDDLTNQDWRSSVAVNSVDWTTIHSHAMKKFPIKYYDYKILHLSTIKTELDQLISNKENGNMDVGNGESLNSKIEEMIHKLDYLKFRLCDDNCNATADPSEIEAITENTLDLSSVQRWLLYRHLLNARKNELQQKIDEANQECDHLYRCADEIRRYQQFLFLKTKKIIGMTSNGSAQNYKILNILRCPIIIAESAGDSLLELTCVTDSCEHLLLFGAFRYTLKEELPKSHLIDIFMEANFTGINTYPLKIQHRMRPEIASLIFPQFQTNFDNHPKVWQYPPICGIEKSVFFVQHKNRLSEEVSSKSKCNIHEAEFLVELARYLVLQGYKAQDLTILVGPVGQLYAVTEALKKYDFLENVRVAIEDYIRGGESKIVLISLVSPRYNFESILKSLLSRAKEGLYIMGNLDLLAKLYATWAILKDTLNNMGSLGTSLPLRCQNHPDVTTLVADVADFLKVPDGGCMQRCVETLPCGHLCPHFCHQHYLQKIICTSC